MTTKAELQAEIEALQSRVRELEQRQPQHLRPPFMHSLTGNIADLINLDTNRRILRIVGPVTTKFDQRGPNGGVSQRICFDARERLSGSTRLWVHKVAINIYDLDANGRIPIVSPEDYNL